MTQDDNTSFDHMVKQATNSVLAQENLHSDSNQRRTQSNQESNNDKYAVATYTVRANSFAIGQTYDDNRFRSNVNVNIATLNSAGEAMDIPVQISQPTSHRDFMSTSLATDKEKHNEINDDIEGDVGVEVKESPTGTTTDSHEHSGQENASSSAGRRMSGFGCRPIWFLWFFVFLVLALAATIAVVMALGLMDGGSSTDNDSVNANPTSTGSSGTGMTTVVFTAPTPTETPSDAPSDNPSDVPSDVPSGIPSIAPTNFPTISTAPSPSPSMQPSDIPSMVPSDFPSDLPSDTPSMVPSMFPTVSMAPSTSPSISPSAAPTAGPTVSAAPTIETHERLMTLLNNVTGTPLEVLSDPQTPQGRALLWMANEDQIVLDLFEEAASTSATVAVAEELLFVTTDNETVGNGTVATNNVTSIVTIPPSTTTEQSPSLIDSQDLLFLPQRFAIVALDFSLHASSDAVWSFSRLHECQWPGVKCDRSEEIIGINWARQNLTGYVVPEISLLTQLETIDMAQNQLTGFLDPFWTLPQLQTLYLFDNQFFGKISSEIGNMYSLEHLYLGNNALTGKIPEALFDLGDLKYLILNHNQLSSTLPDRIRMTDMYYWDLSYNRLNGTLPDLIMPNLRHFAMSNNQLSGTIPDDYADLGSNRLFQFFLNDNFLSGGFPTGWHTRTPHKFLTNVDISNNSLTERLSGSICMLTVYEEGETVEFRADCDICVCGRLCYRWCEEQF